MVLSCFPWLLTFDHPFYYPSLSFIPDLAYSAFSLLFYSSHSLAVSLNSNWMWILLVFLLTQFWYSDFGKIQSYLDSLVTSHKNLLGFHFDPILSRRDLPIDFKYLWCIWFLLVGFMIATLQANRLTLKHFYVLQNLRIHILFLLQSRHL